MSIRFCAFLCLSLTALACFASTPTAYAQNLFEADGHSGTIFEFTPAGVKTTFVTGLFFPTNLAFDSNSNLYEASENFINSVIISKITPAGVVTAFASGLDFPGGLVFAPLAVPEPSSVALLIGLAITGAGFLSRRRRK